MNKFKKSDLLFLSKLDVSFELCAKTYLDEDDKKYWQLHVRAKNNGFQQEGVYYGARGEPRRYYQLNALFDTCSEIFGNCDKLLVNLFPEKAAS